MSKFLKILGILVFIVLTALGVLFLLAAPVDPTRALSRLITGSLLITGGIIILVVLLLITKRLETRVVKVEKVEKKKQKRAEVFNQMVCKNCGRAIELTGSLSRKDVAICEGCGEEIKIPKDEINW